MTAVPDDQGVREAALDPARSFIVQAPAGSGKTELLIQRYLNLLLTVDEPEQIVAITFTRKAAAEMRGRVADALRASAASIQPSQPHRARTHALAGLVLARDAARNWTLLAQPQRLRIDTLDALNAWLARQLPLLSGGVAASSVEENADDQYRAATRRTLDTLWSRDALATELGHLLRLQEHSLVRLQNLLQALLARRDQWLTHMAAHGEAELREILEQSLAKLLDDKLERLEALWPDAAWPALFELLEHALTSGGPATSRPRYTAVPDDTIARLEFWRRVSRLFLTERGVWRRRLTRSEGFLPEHGAAKALFARTVARLDAIASLKAALTELAVLPEPGYTETEWRDVLAFRRVLLHLVAELRVIFASQRKTDFVELALAAQQALGHVDQPSELLLALDHRIQHILVDEFQDTSKTQLRLLEMLTAGWQRGDGRSLFLVGDPMQSIYRFRDADMSLFSQVKQHGIGDIACEVLELTANFRSAPSLVAWTNRAFAGIFTGADINQEAQARFYASTATRPASEGQGVALHLLRTASEDAEARQVIRLLEEERRADEKRSIAILVQSRSHLLGLHGRLEASGWPVHAVEIDAVNERQVGQDLLGLARALSHRGDRIAWLGLLRAPWCGLSWEDLERLSGDDHERTIWELMHDVDCCARLSSDGQVRLAALRGVLELHWQSAGLHSFARWVEWCWRALEGPACFEPPLDQAAAEHFFSVLAKLTSDGGPIDPAMFESAFAKPQRQAEPAAEARIEVMTIHRAKGLEFDTVILFGIGKAPRRDDARGLYWLERRRASGTTDLLLAPLRAQSRSLGRLLKRDEDARELAERARVLYVATTRARERLHLVCRLDPDASSVSRRSLLGCLWPEHADDFATIEVPEDLVPEVVQPELGRLPTVLSPERARRHAGLCATRALDAERLEFEWAGQTAVRVGTLVHDELLRIAATGIEHWTAAQIEARAELYERRLALLGVEAARIEAARARTVNALLAVIDDPTGRWILSSHREAASELCLTLLTPEGWQHLQLDRTFVDERNVRWIVDYKTSRHEGGDVDSFLDSEVERYGTQLERYAAAMSDIDPRPQRVALYFPLLGALRDWAPPSPAITSPSA